MECELCVFTMTAMTILRLANIVRIFNNCRQFVNKVSFVFKNELIII